LIPPDPPLEPGPQEPANDPGSKPVDQSDLPAVASPIPATRPGASIFTIEGRSAPGLFVVGWLATLIGIGLIAVAVLSGDSAPARLLIVVGLVPLSIGLIAGAGSQGVERRVRGVLPYVGPSPFLVFAASIPVSIFILVVVALPLDVVGVPLDGPFGALLSVSIQALVYVALVRLLVVDTGALDWPTMGVRRLDRTAFVEMAGGAAWAVPVILVTAVVSQILLAIFPVNPTSPLPPTGTAGGFALSLLAGAIVAPFGEELLFRAFATTAWAKGIGVRGALVRGSLVFAFAHVLTISGSSAGEAFGLAVVAFAGRIPVALALGWLFLRRRSIWASFGLHAVFNGLLLILAEAYLRST
jgi:membrane protease YdiL (CAAX protease family)